MENSLVISQKYTNRITIWFNNSTPGNISKSIEVRFQREVHTHVHSNIIYNSQKVGATQVFTDRWVCKQNATHMHNETLSNLQKEGSPDSCCHSINLENITLREISQAQRTNSEWFHFSEELRVIKIITMRSGKVIARDRGQDEGFWWRWAVLAELHCAHGNGELHT